MKLFNALVCLDCDELIEAGHACCPSCTNSVLMPLSEWIQPALERDEIELVRTIENAERWPLHHLAALERMR